MDFMSDDILRYIRKSFSEFKLDLSQNLRVRIRRYRAGQIRKLLSNPENVDLEIFNREIWRFESSTKLSGQEIKGQIFTLENEPINSELISNLQLGLETCGIELHGNYMWGSGTNVYAPMLKDDQQKEKNLQIALKILNDSDLSPEDKAKQIMGIPGFGPNIATGLVMIFHPNNFAIYNEKSKKALETIKLDVKNLDIFQNNISILKQNVGAEDFLELDWFLYLLQEGIIKFPPKETDEVTGIALNDKAIPKESTVHDEIQWLLLKLGSDMGLDIWVARNDRNKEYVGQRFRDLPHLKDKLPVHFDEATNKTIELIDVLWLKGNAILAAFEIESTTSIYSGILRMSDLIAMHPNLNIPLYLVVPEERRFKVISEVNRPTFSRLSPPLSKICRLISFSTLRDRVKQVGPYVTFLRLEFLNELSEPCKD
ncbi:MAG: hypothetical protein AB1424_00355 [Thermodesulfobacteriota bacterium]